MYCPSRVANESYLPQCRYDKSVLCSNRRLPVASYEKGSQKEV